MPRLTELIEQQQQPAPPPATGMSLEEMIAKQKNWGAADKPPEPPSPGQQKQEKWWAGLPASESPGPPPGLGFGGLPSLAGIDPQTLPASALSGIPTTPRPQRSQLAKSLETGGENVISGMAGSLYDLIANKIGRSPFMRMMEAGPSLLPEGTAATIEKKARPLEEWAKIIHEDAQRPEMHYKKGEGPWAYVQHVTGQTLPFMTAAMAAGWATGPVGAFGVAAAVEGDNAYRDAIAGGADERTAQTERLIVGTLNGAIEQMQIGGLLKIGKQAGKQLAKGATGRVIAKLGKMQLTNAINEGLEEALQEAVQIGAATMHGDKIEFKQDISRIGEAALGGATAGAILGGASTALQTIQPQVQTTGPETDVGKPKPLEIGIAGVGFTPTVQPQVELPIIEETQAPLSKEERQALQGKGHALKDIIAMSPAEARRILAEPEATVPAEAPAPVAEAPAKEAAAPAQAVPAEPVAPAAPAAKQAWEMTREEFVGADRGAPDLYGDAATPVMPVGTRALIKGEVYELTSEKPARGPVKKWREHGFTEGEEPRVQANSRERFYPLREGEESPEPYFSYIPASEWHKGVVELALHEGQPVPRHVLEEYRGESWAAEALKRMEGEKGDIQEILDAAREPVPNIVEVFELEGDNGKWYRASGFPAGVKHTGQRRSIGFAFADRNGVRYGKLGKTRQELVDRHNARQDANAADFREELQNMSPEQVQSQLDFWRGRVAQEQRLKVPPPVKAETAPKPKQSWEQQQRAELKRLKAKKYKIAADDIKIERIQRQLKENTDRIQAGHGVGWNPTGRGQVNRGFRVIEVYPETRQAKIQAVVDVGQLADYQHGKTEIVDTIDLIRDKRFDAQPSAPQAKGKKVEVVLVQPGESVSTPLSEAAYKKEGGKGYITPETTAKARREFGRRLKAFARAVPEFTEDPVFTVRKEGEEIRLVYRDGYKFSLVPEYLGLDSGSLSPGQTVRVDMVSWGIKKASRKRIETAKALHPAEGPPVGKTPKKPIPIEVQPTTKAAEAREKKRQQKAAEEHGPVYTAIEKIHNKHADHVRPGGAYYSGRSHREPGPAVEYGDLLAAVRSAQEHGWRDFVIQNSLNAATEGDLTEQIIRAVREVYEQPSPPAEQPPAKPPKGTSGAPGFPVTAEGPARVVESEVQPAVTARQIIKTLSRALRVPIHGKATHRMRGKLGHYEIKPQGVRQVNVQDLDTAAHEVGHHIDHYFGIRKKGTTKAGRRSYKMPAPGLAKEMQALGKRLYGDRKPPGGYRSEGIAEFVRGYLTDHIDIRKVAPKFYRWFTKDYLPNNPEVANALVEAKELYRQWSEQGAEARLESKISERQPKGAIRERLHGARLWLRAAFWDELAPLEEMRKVLGYKVAETPKDIEALSSGRRADLMLPKDDPYTLATYYNQVEAARARHMVLDATIDIYGNPTGKGLREVMEPVVKQRAIRSFRRWIVARRALDWHKRGLNPGISRADAQYVYDKYKDNEGWDKVAEEVTAWNNRVVEYLVQAGGLEAKVAERFKELNPIYVPFLREFAESEKRLLEGAGSGLLPTGKLHAAKGSGREIIDPYQSMIYQARRIISLAHKTMVARALANLADKATGTAKVMWKVPTPKRAMTFRTEQVKRQLQKMGVEFPEGGLEEMDALLTVYGNAPVYYGKDNIIAIVRNGKRTFYEVEPRLYRVLKGLDQFVLPRYLRLTLALPNRMVRLGATGVNAAFGWIRNPIRDSLDTIFKAKFARGPWASTRGLAQDLSTTGLAKALGITPSEAALAYMRQGGEIAGFVGQDRTSLAHVKGEMLASTVGRKTIHTVRHPIDAMRLVFGVTEKAPRIAEYNAALKHYEKIYGEGSPDAKVLAFNAASDQTINFRRHGWIGKVLNQMIPFWNANIQDPSKFVRTLGSRGVEASAYAFAFLTVPAFLLWWKYKDEEWYTELPDYERANYIHIEAAEDSIVRLPVPFLVGHVFQSIPVATLDALYRSDPERVTSVLRESFESNVETIVDAPAAVAPLLEVAMNKDWADRPIVTESLKNKPATERYLEHTSEFAKNFAKYFNKLSPKKLAPVQVEHLLNAYSGGIYRRAQAMEAQLRLPPEAQAPANRPIVGTLFVREPYSPRQSIEQYYRDRQRLNEGYHSEKGLTGEEHIRRLWLNRAGVPIGEMWDKLRDTKNVEERKALFKEMKRQIEGAQRPITQIDMLDELAACTTGIETIQARLRGQRPDYLPSNYKNWVANVGQEERAEAIRKSLGEVDRDTFRQWVRRYQRAKGRTSLERSRTSHQRDVERVRQWREQRRKEEAP